MVDTAQEAAFIATELPYAQSEQARTGIPVSVFLAQSADETGWGTSSWFLQHNNPAGIGVTGAPGKGNTYSSLAAAFDDYANKLLGQGEAGQQQFAADVAGGAAPLTLLRDLEASPWAAGHYGGNGLESIWQANDLGAYDQPGATPPSASTIATSSTRSSTTSSAQLAGFFPGGNWDPLNWPGALIGGLIGGAKADVATVVFGGLFLAAGLTMVVLGAWRTVKDTPAGDAVRSLGSTAANAGTAAALA